jgi:pimeloyl-ACP methyl ester carboxylesterase
MRGEFVDVGGVRLYYYAAGTGGEGEPIVFLHGFPTSSHIWRDVVPLVPAGRRMVVVDLLGYGRSDRPDGRDLSIKGHAERVLALLDVLRISFATVVGHDLGGGIAQYLAIRHPTRVARLCLISSVAFDSWPTREVKIVKATLPLTRFLPSSWVGSVLRSDLLRGYSDEEHGGYSVDMYIRPFEGADGRNTLVEHLAALDSKDTVALAPRLKDIVAPTAILTGAHDPFLPVSVAERLHAEIPRSTLEVIPTVRHFVPEVSPQSVGDAITELVAR